MSQVRKPKRLGARSFRLVLASWDNGGPRRKFSLSLKSFMRSIAFRLHSRKFVMYEFRYAKEHPIARTFHKAFQLVERCLLLGLMVAVSLEAQQSSPSAPAWTGVVRTAAGEPVAGAKVTVYTAAAKEKMTAVTGSEGRFAIAAIRPGHRFTGSRSNDTGPRWRRRRTLLCFKRDRDHQSQQQTPLYQLEGLMKGSRYWVFLCVSEFIHDKFPRMKTEFNRAPERLL